MDVWWANWCLRRRAQGRSFLHEAYFQDHRHELLNLLGMCRSSSQLDLPTDQSRAWSRMAFPPGKSETHSWARKLSSSSQRTQPRYQTQVWVQNVTNLMQRRFFISFSVLSETWFWQISPRHMPEWWQSFSEIDATGLSYPFQSGQWSIHTELFVATYLCCWSCVAESEQSFFSLSSPLWAMFDFMAQAIRQSLLKKYATIRSEVDRLHNSKMSPYEKLECLDTIKSQIQGAWRTDEIRRQKPTPQVSCPYLVWPPVAKYWGRACILTQVALTHVPCLWSNVVSQTMRDGGVQDFWGSQECWAFVWMKVRHGKIRTALHNF